MIPRHPRKSEPPGRVAVSLGVHFAVVCLPALAGAVKPLAYVAGSYARCDRHEEINDMFHGIHLLPVASLEKGSVYSLPDSGKFRKGFRKTAPPQGHSPRGGALLGQVMLVPEKASGVRRIRNYLVLNGDRKSTRLNSSHIR